MARQFKTDIQGAGAMLVAVHAMIGNAKPGDYLLPELQRQQKRLANFVRSANPLIFRGLVGDGRVPDSIGIEAAAPGKRGRKSKAK